MTPTQQLIDAAQAGNLAEVLRLIPLANPKEQDSEALAQAARHGHVACVDALIGVSDPYADSSFALWIAACQGHSECVEKLIPVSGVSDGGCRALNVAARNGHTQCIRLLMPFHSQKQRVAAVAGPLLVAHVEGLKELVSGIKHRSELLPYFRQALYEDKLDIADALFDALPPNTKNSMQILYPEYCAQKQKAVLEQHVGAGSSKRSRRKL